MAFGDFALGGFNMAQTMAGQQGGHLAGMANQAMNAISQENASRVAQQREAKRMQHERDMRVMELEHMIRRLEMELAGRQRSSSGLPAWTHNPKTRTWMPS